MYLFFFAVLFIIFQYANEKTIYESQEKQIINLKDRLDKAEAETALNEEAINNDAYFTLRGNDNAMSYIERLGLEADDVERMITDKLYDNNGIAGGNPIIPLKGVQGDFKINKVQFLNHRWILADFSDGKNWGEMIIEYFFDENNNVDLTPVSSLLYSGN